MSLVNIAYAPALTWAHPTLNSLEEQAVVPMSTARPFPVSCGAVSIPRGKVDMFVTRFDPRLNIIRSALFGGSGGDTLNSVAVDQTGAV